MSSASEHAYLITGASRGLGYALARQLLQEGATVACVSRRAPAGLQEEGAGRFRFIALDLAETDTLLAQVDRLWEFAAGRAWSGLYLVNNAASSLPLGHAERNDAVEVARAVQINLIAPMLLTNSFMRVTEGLAPDRRVLNISSGAGRRPVAYLSAYCATKAGLDLYSQCVGLEQDQRAQGIRIASLAPGIIDTDMQAVSRGLSEEEFPGRQQFVDYYEKGELATPADAAAKVLRILHSDAVHRGELLNIRDFE